MSSPDDDEEGRPVGDFRTTRTEQGAGSGEDGASAVAGGDAQGDEPSPDAPVSFVVRCAVCGAETSVTTDQAGKRGRCGVCGGTFLILPPPGFGALPVAGFQPPETTPFDGPPHRGRLIQSLGLSAMAALALAVVVTSCCPYVPVDLIGVGIGIAAWIMGRRDLKAMDRGAMDPSGREKTRLGYALGICTVALGMFLVLLRFTIFALVALTILLGPKFKPAPPGGFAPPPPTTQAPQPTPVAPDDLEKPVVPPDVQGLDR